MCVASCVLGGALGGGVLGGALGDSHTTARILPQLHCVVLCVQQAACIGSVAAKQHVLIID